MGCLDFYRKTPPYQAFHTFFGVFTPFSHLFQKIFLPYNPLALGATRMYMTCIGFVYSRFHNFFDYFILYLCAFSFILKLTYVLRQVCAFSVCNIIKIPIMISNPYLECLFCHTYIKLFNIVCVIGNLSFVNDVRR